MKTQGTVINELDQSRLRNVITHLRISNFYTPWENGDELQSRIESADSVPPPKVPADLVTMNSTVRVRDLDKQREHTYTLVFPSESDPLDGRISVLSKLGLALFGARIGDVVDFQTPSGTRHIEIVALEYQPEAAKDWSR